MPSPRYILLILSSSYLISTSNGEVVNAITNGIIGQTVRDMNLLGTYHMKNIDKTGCFNPNPDGSCSDKMKINSYCCERNVYDRTWTGYWFGPKKATFYNCEFRPALNGNKGYVCGGLICAKENEFEFHETKIGGTSCDEVELFGMKGKAHAGMILWNNGTEMWFKHTVL